MSVRGSRASVSGDAAEGVKVPSENRMLAQLLLNKTPKLNGSLEDKVMLEQMQKVHELITHLVANPHKIQHAVLAITTTSDINKLSRKRKNTGAMNDDPNFDPDEVKTLGDVPASWLWGWVKQQSTFEIEADLIASISKKSAKPLRTAVGYFTGLPLDYAISDSLGVKDTFSAFLTSCAVDRGNLVNKGNGFFKDTVTSDGQIQYTGYPHGVFAFKASSTDETKAGGIMCNLPMRKGVDGSKVKGEIDLSKEQGCAKDTQIQDNHNVHTAYIVIWGNKQYLAKLFPRGTFAKSDEEMTKKVMQCVAQKAQEINKDCVVVDEELMEATKRKRPKASPSAPSSIKIG